MPYQNQNQHTPEDEMDDDVVIRPITQGEIPIDENWYPTAYGLRWFPPQLVVYELPEPKEAQRNLGGRG